MGDFADIVKAAAAGDDRAFACLWREFHAPLLRYLLTMAPVAAEDIAAEVWVDVVRRLAKFSGDEQAFRAWLFTMARRRLIDHWRAAARTPAQVPVHEVGEAMGAAADTADTAIEQLDTDSALRLIATLPPDQAEVIVLRSVAGLDVKQVARIVGKSPGAVRVLAHRGLRSLAVRMAGAPTATTH